MNINDACTLTACYESSRVPLSNFSRLCDLIGESELSWATAPSVCILNRAPEGMMTPSQFRSRYSRGKVIEYPGHNVAFSAPMNFDVEPAEIMSTQSLNESTAPPWATPDSHEHQSEPPMVDLTMDQTTSTCLLMPCFPGLTPSLIFPMKNAVDSRQNCGTSDLR